MTPRAPLLTLLLATLCQCQSLERGGRVEYTGGTLAEIRTGASGLIKTSAGEYMLLVTGKTTLRLLFERINLLEYGQQVSRHYAVGILVAWKYAQIKKKKHFLTIGFVDDQGRQQAIVFTVDKSDIRTLLASLEARTGRQVEFQDAAARQEGRW